MITAIAYFAAYCAVSWCVVLVRQSYLYKKDWHTLAQEAPDKLTCSSCGKETFSKFHDEETSGVYWPCACKAIHVTLPDNDSVTSRLNAANLVARIERGLGGVSEAFYRKDWIVPTAEQVVNQLYLPQHRV